MRFVSKAVFQALAGSRSMKSLASRYGLRSDTSFARRFVAGETAADAVAAARRLEAAGLHQTLDFLGESIATMAEADRATRAYLGILKEIAASGIGRNVSLKLTQLGLTVDRATVMWTASDDTVRRTAGEGDSQRREGYRLGDIAATGTSPPSSDAVTPVEAPKPAGGGEP